MGNHSLPCDWIGRNWLQASGYGLQAKNRLALDRAIADANLKPEVRSLKPACVVPSQNPGS